MKLPECPAPLTPELKAWALRYAAFAIQRARRMGEERFSREERFRCFDALCDLAASRDEASRRRRREPDPAWHCPDCGNVSKNGGVCEECSAARAGY